MLNPAILLDVCDNSSRNKTPDDRNQINDMVSDLKTLPQPLRKNALRRVAHNPISMPLIFKKVSAFSYFAPISAGKILQKCASGTPYFRDIEIVRNPHGNSQTRENEQRILRVPPNLAVSHNADQQGDKG